MVWATLEELLDQLFYSAVSGEGEVISSPYHSTTNHIIQRPNFS